MAPAPCPDGWCLMGGLKVASVAHTYEWRLALRGRVSPNALALAFVLSTYMDTDGSLPERFTPSLARLTADMGLAPSSSKTVMRATAELEEAGFLEVKRALRGSKRLNRYRATKPADGTSSAASAVVAQEPHVSAPSVVAQPPQATTTSGSGATLPSLSPSQILPIPALPDTTMGAAPRATNGSKGETRAARAHALTDRALSLLPPVDAQAVVQGLRRTPRLKQFGELLARLDEAGLGDAAVHEMTRLGLPGTASPYHGAKDPFQTMWGRLRALERARLPIS